MRHRHLVALVIAVAATFASAGGAAEIDSAPPKVSVPKAPANCNQWTDECVNCSRGTVGAPPVCSNIGIACQPQAIRCLSPDVPQGEPSKK